MSKQNNQICLNKSSKALVVNKKLDVDLLEKTKFFGYQIILYKPINVVKTLPSAIMFSLIPYLTFGEALIIILLIWLIARLSALERSVADLEDRVAALEDEEEEPEGEEVEQAPGLVNGFGADFRRRQLQRLQRRQARGH
uniref:Uncharacterized protein n=1 Tax=Meloidogyne incognita TaxID=6306 RepID=A0A914LNI2_MELIC